MSFIDRLFVGKVIKDFGPIEQKSLGIGRITKSVLLTQKNGKFYFVLKFSAWLFPFSASVSYHDFPLEQAYKIRDYINESQQLASNTSALSFEPAREALPETIVGAIIATIFMLVLPPPVLLSIGLLILAALIAKQQWDLRNAVNSEPQSKLQLVMLLGIPVMIGLARLLTFVFNTPR